MVKRIVKTSILVVLTTVGIITTSHSTVIRAAESTEKVAGNAYCYSDWSDYDLTEKDFTVEKDRIASNPGDSRLFKGRNYCPPGADPAPFGCCL